MLLVKRKKKKKADYNKELDRRGTTVVVDKKEVSGGIDSKLTDMFCKNQVEMQTQKKFQVESEKYEFLIKFEQEKKMI